MSVKSFRTGTRAISMLAGNTPEHHVLIAESTVGSGGASSVTFSSIPSTYQHLQIRFLADLDTADRVLRLRLNGISTTGTYAKHGLEGNGSSASSYAVTSTSATWLDAGYNPSGNTNPCVAIIDILNYADTVNNKTIRTLAGNDQNGAGLVSIYSGLFLSSSAISSVEFSLSGTGSFTNGSSFQLYGIK